MGHVHIQFVWKAMKYTNKIKCYTEQPNPGLYTQARKGKSQKINHYQQFENM